MINTHLPRRIAALSAMVALMTATGLAQQAYTPPQDGIQAQETEAPRLDAPERKTGGFLHRPAKDSPAAQLDYAGALAQDGRWRKAVRQYNALVHRWPHAEEAPSAQRALARLLYSHGRYERAFMEFQYLIRFFPGQFDYHAVLEDQLRIANHIMDKRRLTFGVFPGFASPERALPMLETLIRNAPNWTKTAAIRLAIGMIYENNKERTEAVKAYESVIYHHPSRPEAETAIFRKACCLADLSNRSPRDERRCREALSAFASYLRLYPEGEQRAEAEHRMQTLRKRLEHLYLDRAHYYDRIEKRPESAMIAYREFVKQFPASEKTEAVLARMAEIESQTPNTLDHEASE